MSNTPNGLPYSLRLRLSAREIAAATILTLVAIAFLLAAGLTSTTDLGEKSSVPGAASKNDHSPAGDKARQRSGT